MTEEEAFRVSTDPADIDVAAVHAFLASSYWSPGLPRAVLERAIAGSLCFSLLEGKEQAGFARVITDRASFAYLADVYVLERLRGLGLGHRLMEAVLAHPDLALVRRFVLVTRDAHRLYEDFGFGALADPSRYMERVRDTKALWAGM